MSEHQIYWGETHDNVYQRPNCPVSMAQNVAYARDHLDFYAPALYVSAHVELEARDGAMQQGKPATMVLEQWKDDETLARHWQELEEQTGAFCEPGAFVTFPGYEWQGDGRWGDHNVIFREEGNRIVKVNTLPELYAGLRGLNAVAIPHHTAYIQGCRGKDWSVHDETLTPFAEIYSVHGGSETDEECCGLRINSKLGPSVSGGTYQDALDLGLHVGAIGSTDGQGIFPGHYNWGRMACLAPELTREALWDAFLKRHVYGVTGDRIGLDFRVNDAVMGSCIAAAGSRTLRVSVTGSDALDRVEVLRNGRVMHTYCHQGTWHVPEPGQRSRFKFRVEAGWGPFVGEAAERGPRRWSGALTLPETARFVDFEPCWTSAGQERPVLTRNRATFAILASPIHSAELSVSRTYNANVFEFEARPEDALTVAVDGLNCETTVGELCVGSRVLWHDLESRDALKRRFGLDVDTFERPTFNYLLSYKAKLHRIIPEAGYTAAFEIVDDEPLEAEVNYRIRVEQRNGQKAWSSPIWVQPNGD